MTDDMAIEQPIPAAEAGARRWQIFLLAIAILLADLWVVDLAHQLRVWADLPKFSQWNWLGKAASIAFSCLVLAGFPWLRHNVGLRWRQRPARERCRWDVLRSIWRPPLASVFWFRRCRFRAKRWRFSFSCRASPKS